MTAVGVGELDAPEVVELVADTETPLGRVRMADFAAACLIDARDHDGEVHPSRVSALLHQQYGEIDPRSFAARWAPACGPDGFLDKTTGLAPIDPTHSRGNGNKLVPLRRWRGWPATS